MSRGYPVAARHHEHAGRNHREAAKATKLATMSRLPTMPTPPADITSTPAMMLRRPPSPMWNITATNSL